MTVKINQVTFDSHDAYAQSLFWSAVMGLAEDPDDPNDPSHDEDLITNPDGSVRLLFINVPEPKAIKNRVHLDLSPVDSTRDEEVDRIVALGATILDDRRRDDRGGWVVLHDPEGNEFCVDRSPAEKEAAELAGHPS